MAQDPRRPAGIVYHAHSGRLRAEAHRQRAGRGAAGDPLALPRGPKPRPGERLLLRRRQLLRAVAQRGTFLDEYRGRPPCAQRISPCTDGEAQRWSSCSLPPLGLGSPGVRSRHNAPGAGNRVVLFVVTSGYSRSTSPGITETGLD